MMIDLRAYIRLLKSQHPMLALGLQSYTCCDCAFAIAIALRTHSNCIRADVAAIALRIRLRLCSCLTKTSNLRTYYCWP